MAVVRGRPNSGHLAEIARPSLSDIPGGRRILVKVLRVGVDGTDKESTPPSTAPRRAAYEETVMLGKYAFESDDADVPEELVKATFDAQNRH